ncbi:conjugative transposon protein TraM [Mucilaginibacter roseus]|uniref:Conjugative transposon protein TraM n=1 Tax=Mucilaginibacter roseus TaxID=1528868 RepID=A0ABS8TWS0_9SPHI|nr:conjugative transposon protein TraM [Mucilaginibacter roseus]MCD8739333.1 conjugative transposon protein TraM [Mucilaginibacter roseus]
MEKQRKFLLVLPLLVLPFLTMAFWALGGGKAGQTTITQTKGLDIDLPEAQFKEQDQAKTKLAVYEAAKRDSSQDPISPAFLQSIGMSKGDSTIETAPTADDQAQKIHAKLAQLNQQLNQPQQIQQQAIGYDGPEPHQLKQLKKMMRNVNSSSAADPEMAQLNQMLDKIQAIQNPTSAIVSKRVAKESAKPFRAISAIIDGKQKVADGATVKLRLTDTATIKKQFLAKGQEIYGSCQITNQRLLLTIHNIRLEKQIIPVDLTVFSLDGMPGIPAPEAELSGVAGTNADQALQSMQILSMDQSIGAQAAAGGINAAKELFSKKVKKIKVKLQNEYPVLLKINR